MSIRTKVLLFVGAISWLALVVEVFCLELADVLFEDMAVLFVITLLFVIGFMVLFVYDYYKGKKLIVKGKYIVKKGHEPEIKLVERLKNKSKKIIYIHNKQLRYTQNNQM